MMPVSFFAGCFGAATAASAWAAEDHHQAVAEVPDQLAGKTENIADTAHTYNCGSITSRARSSRKRVPESDEERARKLRD
jgi:hypothetical protein